MNPPFEANAYYRKRRVYIFIKSIKDKYVDYIEIELEQNEFWLHETIQYETLLAWYKRSPTVRTYPTFVGFKNEEEAEFERWNLF